MIRQLLFTFAAIASTVAANADFGFYYKLDTIAKTAIITGYDPQYTRGELELPLNISSGKYVYNIIGVKPHALDNMQEVTSVKIPAHYTQLGNITAEKQDVRKMSDNGGAFLINCPKLEKVSFTGENSVAKVTKGGILTSIDGKDTYLVPPRMALSDTRLKMSSTCTRIGAGAFAGNTGISTIVFPSGLEYVAPDAGFHLMHQISAYEIDASNKTFQIHNGALIDKKAGILISLPRYYNEGTSYFIDYTRTQIVGDYAFANNQFIVKYDIPAPIKQIGDYAFSGSNIGQATLFPDVDLSVKGKGAFKSCPRLTSIIFKGENFEIPSDFASDCENLLSVVCENRRPAGVGARAFRNCTKLNEFPFAGDIQWRGDSIFANTGFKEVKFAVSLYSVQENASKGLFTGCRELQKIDLGSVSFLNAGQYYPISTDFASNCPALRELIFPNFTDFSIDPFTGDNAIDKLVLSNFTRAQQKVIAYTTEGPHYPKVYLRVPAGHKSASSPLYEFFYYSFEAEGRISYYCAGYNSAFGPDEIVWTSDFYVPGGCTANYPSWTHCEEMFTLQAFGNENIMRVTCQPRFDNVKMERVVFGKGESVEFDDKGMAIAGAAVSTVEEFTVYYTVDDVPMWTIYPASTFSSSAVTEITDDPADSIRCHDGILSFGTEADYSIYTTSGICVKKGRGAQASTAELPAAIYLVNATIGGRNVTTKIVLR